MKKTLSSGFSTSQDSDNELITVVHGILFKFLSLYFFFSTNLLSTAVNLLII